MVEINLSSVGQLSFQPSSFYLPAICKTIFRNSIYPADARLFNPPNQTHSDGHKFSGCRDRVISALYLCINGVIYLQTLWPRPQTSLQVFIVVYTCLVCPSMVRMWVYDFCSVWPGKKITIIHCK